MCVLPAAWLLQSLIMVSFFPSNIIFPPQSLCSRAINGFFPISLICSIPHSRARRQVKIRLIASCQMFDAWNQTLEAASQFGRLRVLAFKQHLDLEFFIMTTYVKRVRTLRISIFSTIDCCRTMNTKYRILRYIKVWCQVSLISLDF